MTSLPTGHADTAHGYAGRSATKHTSFMLMLSVALGKVKDYTAITYGLTAPPKVALTTVDVLEGHV